VKEVSVMTRHEQHGCPVDADFDPLSDEFLVDPYQVLAGTAMEPVFYAESIGYYVITKYADIEQVFRDPDTYSAAAAQSPLGTLVSEAQQILLAGGHQPQPSMVSLDEPAHGRLRRPAARAFSVRRVNAMVPVIEATTRCLLDAVADLAEFDVVAALSFPLPANVVFSMMGVPERDFGQLKQWCGYRMALSFGRPAPAEQVDIATNIAAYRKYFRALVESKISQRADDLASELLSIHDEKPDELTLEEVASILFSLSIAGHETTTALITNIVRVLLDDRRRWEAVVADPSMIPGVIDETLRFEPAVAAWRRVTTRPVQLGGVDLPEGARLFLWLAAGGRDAAMFADPGTFDPRRSNAADHLAFGRGRHYCLGASLAKIEAGIAVDQLSKRFPRLRPVADQSLSFHPNISFRAPQQLRVRSQ
jgi:cytochrome P450